MPDPRNLLYRLALLSLLAIVCACGKDGGKDGGTGSTAEGVGAAGADADWLVDVSADVGIDFVHGAKLEGRYAMMEIMGSGGALFDYDNDGDLDIFLVSSGPRDPDAPDAPDARSHALYRQDTDGHFRDVAAAAGITDAGHGMGATVGDYDNDGDLDLLVTNYGPDVLYRNEGDGTFADVSQQAGITIDAWSMSAAFFDYDRDGFLDLYVATYLQYDPQKVCRDSAGRVEYCGPLAFPGCADLLYHNNRDGTFTEVARQAGTSSTAGRGLGVVTYDFNGDGWQDVFVANDGVSNHLWINSGKGTFEDRALAAGVAVNSQGMPEASMGVALGDVDGDLELDLFLTHLDRETNTLYTAGARSSFQDRTARAGLGPDSLPYTGFGTAFFDLENDGDLDLLVVNGRVRRGHVATVDAADPLAAYRQPNRLALNLGGGRFDFGLELARGFSTVLDVSRGLMVGDVDRDGALDVLVTNCHGPARLYRNAAPDRGQWLAVRALDKRRHRDAIGSRIYILAGERWHVRPVTHAHSYLVGTDATAHFGLGRAMRADRIVVRWPDGTYERFPPSDVGRVIAVVRGTGEPTGAPVAKR